MNSLVHIALLASFPVAASEFSSLVGIDDLMVSADEIVAGRVSATKALSKRDGLIYTQVTLAVERALHQPKGKDLSFSVPGGMVDGVQLSVPGAPRFRTGDEVVVFLADGGDLGLGQGALFKSEHGYAQADQPLGTPTVSVKSILGDGAEVGACLSSQLRIAATEDWSVRGTISAGLMAKRARAVEVSLLGGLTYRFGVCTDGHSDTMAVTVFDPDGNPAAESYVDGKSTQIELRPKQTGRYTVVVESGSLLAARYRSAFGLNISYR